MTLKKWQPYKGKLPLFPRPQRRRDEDTQQKYEPLLQYFGQLQNADCPTKMEKLLLDYMLLRKLFFVHVCWHVRTGFKDEQVQAVKTAKLVDLYWYMDN